MFIVSQTKQQIVNTECMATVFVMGKEIKSASLEVDGTILVLGTYETDQRVSQVMQEIWSAYANDQKVYQMP